MPCWTLVNAELGHITLLFGFDLNALDASQVRHLLVCMHGMQRSIYAYTFGCQLRLYVQRQSCTPQNA